MNGTSFDWTGIIGLLVIAGVFGGGMWGNNGYNMENRFIERDIFNTNSNVLTSACSTQKEVLESKANCNNNYSNLRFDNAVGQANIDKDVLLGNQNIQAQLDNCCCTLRTEFRDGIQSVKDLINNNTIQDLRDKVADKDRELLATGLSYGNTITANNVEERILGKLGRYIPYAGYNPYYGYGTTLQ